MNQTTNSILMIRPVAFRMNEQTAVNNYYQKVIDGLMPATVNAKAQQEFDAFVSKLKAVGVDVIVVEDTLNPDTPDSIFPNNWISFHENGDIALFPMFAENRRLERREDILDILEEKGFEMELAWVCDESNKQFQRVPDELVAEADKAAKDALEAEDM